MHGSVTLAIKLKGVTGATRKRIGLYPYSFKVSKEVKPQSHVRKMASFHAYVHCDVCLKEFDYEYRYERHE